MKIILKGWVSVPKAFIMMIIATVLSMIGAVIWPYIVALVANIFQPNADVKSILTDMIYLFILQAICDVIGIYLKNRSITMCFTKLYDRYYTKMLVADYNMYTKYTEAYLDRASNFVNKIAHTGNMLSVIAIAASRVIANIYAIYTVGSGVVVPILILYAIGVVVISFLYKKINEIDAIRNKIYHKRNQESENVINGFREVRSFNRVNDHIKSITGLNNESAEKTTIKMKIQVAFKSALSIVDAGGIIIIVLYTIKQIAIGLMNAATGMQLLTYTLSITSPLVQLMDIASDINEDMSIKEDYEKVMNYDNIYDPNEVMDIDSFKDSIRLDDVSFAYDNSDTVIHNINMDIKKGQKIGICGESGSGKSSLFKLLNRFYGTNNGDILIDGININDITKDSFHKLVGAVHQENIIFPGTIRENIRYASPNCTDVELVEACEKAKIYDFIMAQSDKFDTEVGPNGVKLSGGQKQRIALARLFLQNPEIILMDEATSALDNESETFVQEAIDSLHGKTIITIAHRLSTIKNSDCIYVFDNGQIVEKGNHEELMAKKGVYYKMQK